MDRKQKLLAQHLRWKLAAGRVPAQLIAKHQLAQQKIADVSLTKDDKKFLAECRIKWSDE